MAEKKVLAQLVMDRAEPLGNSEDKTGRRALHVIIQNSEGEPIEIEVSALLLAFFNLETQLKSVVGKLDNVLSHLETITDQKFPDC